MCGGRGWLKFLILPFGLWCLSASNIRSMMVLFAVWVLSVVLPVVGKSIVTVFQLKITFSVDIHNNS